ncbi:MAG: hypothetical protein II411_06045 [Lachnospiraceae bacterium]|nr:hypothetical protein [Lachnospiraceae bacterium]
MAKGIIIDRKYIVSHLYKKEAKEGDRPAIVLTNGEVLDRFLTLSMRNLDFSGNFISFRDIYGIEYQTDQCAFIKTYTLETGEIIEDIICSDDEIIEELLR